MHVYCRPSHCTLTNVVFSVCVLLTLTVKTSRSLYTTCSHTIRSIHSHTRHNAFSDKAHNSFENSNELTVTSASPTKLNVCKLQTFYAYNHYPPEPKTAHHHFASLTMIVYTFIHTYILYYAYLIFISSRKYCQVFVRSLSPFLFYFFLPFPIVSLYHVVVFSFAWQSRSKNKLSGLAYM